MLWKRLYKDNIWANDVDELEGLSSDISFFKKFVIQQCGLVLSYVFILIGLNKDLKRMVSEHAVFGALSFKDIRSASDGTRKVN